MILIDKIFIVVENHILLCLCRMLYRHLCQWKIQSFYNLKFYFLLFWQEVHQCLIYRERDFLQDLKGVLNLGLCSPIFCYGKTPESKGMTLFLYLFVCCKNLSQNNINN